LLREWNRVQVPSKTPVTLEAFDVDGNLVASQTLPDIGGATLQAAAPGIHRVRYLGTADEGGAAVDDFTFNPVTPTTIVAIDIKAEQCQSEEQRDHFRGDPNGWLL
jgi:hypothetical protein